jgi:DNA invertase Pin-like site-specific DNA recombinase
MAICCTTKLTETLPGGICRRDQAVRIFFTGIKSKARLAQRMHASGESASTIAATMGVSRATVYRVLAESAESSD